MVSFQEIVMSEKTEIVMSEKKQTKLWGNISKDQTILGEGKLLRYKCIQMLNGEEAWKFRETSMKL